MKRLISHILPLLFVLVACSACERLTIPVISQTKISEPEVGVVNAKAIMRSKQIDECGIYYSSSSSKPSLNDNDAIICGDLDSDGTFTATLTLKANTIYWFVFFATNELGTATSETIKFQTGQFSPNKDDNPLPNP